MSSFSSSTPKLIHSGTVTTSASTESATDRLEDAVHYLIKVVEEQLLLQRKEQNEANKRVKICKYATSRKYHDWFATFEQRCKEAKITSERDQSLELQAHLDEKVAYSLLIRAEKEARELKELVEQQKELLQQQHSALEQKLAQIEKPATAPRKRKKYCIYCCTEGHVQKRCGRWYKDQRHARANHGSSLPEVHASPEQ